MYDNSYSFPFPPKQIRGKKGERRNKEIDLNFRIRNFYFMQFYETKNLGKHFFHGRN